MSEKIINTDVEGPCARSQNDDYRVVYDTDGNGCPLLRVVAKDPLSRAARSRQMKAFLHEIAADLERRSDEKGVNWAISIDAINGYVVIDIAARIELECAYGILEQLLAERERGRSIPWDAESETQAIQRIAKEKLGLETLDRRWSDELDFSDQAVWCLRVSLESAFRAGIAAGARKQPTAME